MARCFALHLALVLVSVEVCLQSSCARDQDPSSPEGAAGCGCDKLRRTSAGVEVSEEERASSQSAVKYTAAANEKISEVSGGMTTKSNRSNMLQSSEKIVS